MGQLSGKYKSDVRIAVQENGSGFYSYLKKQGIEAIGGYTGAFDGLLLINPRTGLMAAVDIVSIIETGDASHMKAEVSVNGSFFHSPPLVLNLLSKFFSRLVPLKSITELITIISWS